jgi:hypothetical protein
LTTIISPCRRQLLLDPRAARSAAAQASLELSPLSPPKTAREGSSINGFLPCCRRLSGRWKSGNPGFGCPLFHGPHFAILFLPAVLSDK